MLASLALFVALLPASTIAEWATCRQAQANAQGVWLTEKGCTTAVCSKKPGATEPPPDAKTSYRLEDSKMLAQTIAEYVLNGGYEVQPTPASTACQLDSSFSDSGTTTPANYIYVDKLSLLVYPTFVYTGWVNLHEHDVQLCVIGLHDYPNSYDCTCEWRGLI